MPGLIAMTIEYSAERNRVLVKVEHIEGRTITGYMTKVEAEATARRLLREAGRIRDDG